MRAEGAVMHALLRATAVTAAVAGVLSCATPPRASASGQNEYKWLILHGCNCGGIAYASGSAAPSWLGGQTFAGYVYDTTMRCASRQFVVVAFGDGGSDLASDLNLARARAAPFLRRLSNVKYRRLDTLVFAGPHSAHPSTLAILCPADRLPA